MLDRYEIALSSPLPAYTSTLLRARESEGETFEEYREEVGFLLCIAYMTRPDMMDAVREVVRYTRDRAARHSETVGKILSLETTSESGMNVIGMSWTSYEQ